MTERHGITLEPIGRDFNAPNKIEGPKQELLKAKKDYEKEKDAAITKAQAEEGLHKEKILLTSAKSERQTDTKHNRASGTATEKVDSKESADVSDEMKKIEKLLNQLARNKKINFPWTIDNWKPSAKEKELAKASAKVFLQLLDQSKNGENMVKKMVSMCKNHSGDLTKEMASGWKSKLGINSKEGDIQSFYKSYLEYQNRNTEYSHLSELVAFFCENGIESIDQLKEQLSSRSKKISKEEIKSAGQKLFREVPKVSEYGHTYTAIIDLKTGKEIDRKPKNWEEEARYMVIKDRLSSDQISSKDKMLMLLGDYNLDGEINRSDVGYKTGGQLMEVFNRIVAMHNNVDKSFDDTKAIQNLIAFANKFRLGIEGDLYEWMTKGPEGYANTKKLQNFIKNLSVDLSDVLKNGENAGNETLINTVSALKLEEKEKAEAVEAAKEKAEEIVKQSAKTFEEKIKDAKERANITQQLLTQLPSMLVNYAADQQGNIAAGASMPLDEIVKGLSASVSAGLDTEGNPVFGVFVGWGKHWDLSKGVDLSTSVTAGSKLGYLGIVAASTELGIDANRKSREKSLDAKGEHRISLGANVAYMGVISAGVSAGFENNKQAGIEKQAGNINAVVKKQAKSWVEALKGAENKEAALKEALQKEFGETSEETLDAATKNILSIVQQFKIDEETTNADMDIYSQIIADVYAEQWRNHAINKTADNKRKLSGGKMGIQFFVGCPPTATLVAKFTKYYNARTVDSEHARARRVEANVNGVGNKNVELKNAGLGQEEVNGINKVLQTYGANSLLKFVPEYGKPGRISVPASLADSAGINVRIASTMKGYVKAESDGSYYSFPANTTYRLFTETGGNQGSLTLNIGSDKSDVNNDILLSDTENVKALVGDKELMGEKRREFVEGSDFVSVDTSLDHQMNFNELFTADVIEGLKRVDSSNRRKFSEFMRTKTNAEKTFDDMLQAVINVLGKDKKYEAIKSELSVPHKDNQGKIITEVATRKQLIMDRIMAISADANVHQKWGLEAVVNGNREVKGRGDYYKKETMVGPNGKPIFSEISVDRGALVKKIHEINNYNAELQTNLLGATAFYNKNNEAKGLAMTGLGVTTVLGGQMAEISGEDRSKVEGWFLGDEGDSYVPGVLEKSPAERSNLKNVVSAYIKNQNIDLKDGSLTNDQLKKILKGEEVELSIDNSSEKVIVKLDVKYMFYLMGECANESVGMQLGKLSLKKQIEVQDYAQGSYVINDAEGSSAVQMSRKDFAVGVAFKAGKDKKGDGETTPKEDEEDIPSPDGTTTPGQIEDPINPDGSSTPGADGTSGNGGNVDTGGQGNSGSSSGGRNGEGTGSSGGSGHSGNQGGGR